MEKEEPKTQAEIERKKFKESLQSGTSQLKEALDYLGLKEGVSLEELNRVYESYRVTLSRAKINNRKHIDRTIKGLKPILLSAKKDFVDMEKEKRQIAEEKGDFLTMEESKQLGEEVKEKRRFFQTKEGEFLKLIQDKNRTASHYSQLETDARKAYEIVKEHLQQLDKNQEKIVSTLSNTNTSVNRQENTKIIDLQKRKEFYFRINSLYESQRYNIGAKANFAKGNIAIKTFPQDESPLLTILNLKDGSIVELRPKMEIAYKSGLEAGINKDITSNKGMISKLEVYQMRIRERTGKIRTEYEVKSEPLNIAQISNDEPLKRFVLLGLFSEEYSRHLPGKYVGNPTKINGRIVVSFDEGAIDLSRKMDMEKEKRQEEIR